MPYQIYYIMVLTIKCSPGMAYTRNPLAVAPPKLLKVIPIKLILPLVTGSIGGPVFPQNVTGGR